MKSVLITGGAGFIGSHIVDELIKIGHSVVVIDDLSGGFEQNVSPRATFIKGSIVDVDLVDSVVENHAIEYIIHTAAYAAEGLSHWIRNFNYSNNLIGSVNLINAAIKHQVKCFVFTSSMAVYGAGQVPFSEKAIPQPEDPYGIAKLAVEQDLKAAHYVFGLNYIIFRPHNVYGERQNIWDLYRNVIGIFMYRLLHDRPVAIFGDGLQQRAFTYVGDVAPFIANCLTKAEIYNKTFNIGSDDPITIMELLSKVGSALDIEAMCEHFPPRCEVKNAYCSHAEIKKVGYSTSCTLETGLAKMARWVRDQDERYSTPPEMEIVYNLPGCWKDIGKKVAREGKLS